jgi:hypothetical protein
VNIWVGDLPKTGRRSVILGDALLIHSICKLTLDPAVRRFTVDWATVKRMTEREGMSGDGMIFVEYLRGHTAWHRIYAGSSRSNVPERPQQSATGVPIEVFFAGNPGEWEIRFDNIITLIQMWNAVRRTNWTAVYPTLQERLALTGIATFEELVGHYPSDRGVALGVVARMLLDRAAFLELDAELFGLNSVVKASETSEVERGHERSVFVQHEPRMPDDEPTLESRPQRGRPRSLAKSYRSTAGWPAPDISAITDPEKVKDYENRKVGVELFVAGADPDTIKRLSGRSVDSARRDFHRCTASADDGEIFGYFALLDNFRVKSYERKANTNGTGQHGSAGYAGVLEQVLTRFGDVKKWLCDVILAEANGKNSIHTSNTFLADRLREKLREQGIGDDEWPLCTSNGGAEAIRRYRQQLVGLGKSLEGSDAGKQANQIGQGPEVVIKSIRPLSFMQMDYQLIGAHVALRLLNKYGKLITIPLKRWYVGYAGYEYPATVAGIAACYEPQPSTDTALETINSILDPRDDVLYERQLDWAQDGKFLLRHFLKKLAWNAFTVLRLDNAWANQSHDTVHNVIDATGCFVCFGPPYQWWFRAFIEGLINRVNARGLARVPSTAGTGPTDPRRRKNPGAVASRTLFDRDDAESIIYGAASDFNTSSIDNLQGSSPIDAAAFYIRTGESGFFLRPLPRETQENSTLVYHRIETTVQVEKRGGNPYLKIKGSRYKVATPSALRPFIGKKVVVFLLRIDARHGKVYAMNTGESLGDVRMQGPMNRARLSWKDFLFFKRQTAADREAHDALSQWSEKRKSMPKSKTVQTAPSTPDEVVPDGRDVLRKERAEKLAARSPEPSAVQQSTSQTREPVTREQATSQTREQATHEFADPWGLEIVRPIKGVHRA